MIGVFDYTVLTSIPVENTILGSSSSIYFALEYTMSSASVLIAYKPDIANPVRVVHSNIEGVDISDPLTFGNLEIFDDLEAFPHSKYFIYSSHDASTLIGYIRFIHYYNNDGNLVQIFGSGNDEF